MTRKTDSNLCMDFVSAFDQLCDALCDSEELIYSGVVPVLTRAMDQNPDATAADLGKALKAEGLSASAGVLEMVIALRSKLGSLWHVAYEANLHRGSGKSIDDRLNYCRDYWDDMADSFDDQRAEEKEVALAWLNRHLKKVA